MELDHRRMLQRARQQFRQRKRVVSLRHSSKYQVRGGLKKMIDEVIDQRTSMPLPVGLRRLFRTFDGTRTRNSRFLMYSESAVNHCLDLKTLERSLDESCYLVLGSSVFRVVRGPLTGKNNLKEIFMPFTSWSPSNRYLRTLMDSHPAVPWQSVD